MRTNGNGSERIRIRKDANRRGLFCWYNTATSKATVPLAPIILARVILNPLLSQARDAKIADLRAKLAKTRLERLAVQKKQWAVASLQEKWRENLEGVRLERSLVAERQASLTACTNGCLRQLDAMSQVSTPPATNTLAIGIG